MAELSNSVERSEVCKANGDVELDDICKRCRSIPWHDFPTFPYSIDIPDIQRESGCRVCRWLAKFRCAQIINNVGSESLYPFPSTKRLEAWQKDIFRESWYIVVSDRTAQTELQSLTPPFISFSRVKELLNTCAEYHTDCSLPGQNHVISNLRVIDCTTRKVVNAPANCEYVALSYVWGSTQSVNDDLASMSVLPRVLEQSIVVASKLGFKFLWIDRYCIDQRNENHKNTQILQMSTIYRGAQLTIIAAAGEDPTHGLPGVKPCRRSPAHGYYEAIGSFCLSALPQCILDGDAYFDDIRNTVWASRAWTFQEAIFSRRRLLFTESQVIFSCDTSTRCEWGSELRNDHHGLEGLQWFVAARTKRCTVSHLHRACDILEQYCLRRMTHDSDALNAIMSTLNFIQKSDGYHIWGVPFYVCESSSDERQQATSMSSSSMTLLGSSDLQMVQIYLGWQSLQPRRRRQGFPSWSPLGWSPGGIEYHDTYQGCVFVDTPRGKESLSTQLLSAKANPAGMAQHISLLLKTRFVGFYEYHTPYDVFHMIVIPLGQGFACLHKIYWDKYVEVEGEMKIAIVSPAYGIGAQVIALHAHEGYYERVGSAFVYLYAVRSRAKDRLLGYLTDGKFTAMSLTADGELEPLDEERLRAAFGDIDERHVGYEEEGFQEELITLG